MLTWCRLLGIVTATPVWVQSIAVSMSLSVSIFQKTDYELSNFRHIIPPLAAL